MLVKVYDLFPSSMYGHVSQPSLELERKPPGRVVGLDFLIWRELKGHED